MKRKPLKDITSLVPICNLSHPDMQPISKWGIISLYCATFRCDIPFHTTCYHNMMLFHVLKIAASRVWIRLAANTLTQTFYCAAIKVTVDDENKNRIVFHSSSSITEERLFSVVNIVTEYVKTQMADVVIPASADHFRMVILWYIYHLH